jgi:hypothetical protein
MNLWQGHWIGSIIDLSRVAEGRKRRQGRKKELTCGFTGIVRIFFSTVLV